MVIVHGENLISSIHLSLAKCHQIFAELIDTQKSTPVSVIIDREDNDYFKYNSTFEIAKDRYLIIKLIKQDVVGMKQDMAYKKSV